MAIIINNLVTSRAWQKIQVKVLVDSVVKVDQNDENIVDSSFTFVDGVPVFAQLIEKKREIRKLRVTIMHGF